MKFKDADLIGFPIRINVGPRSLQSGNAEVVLRRSKEKAEVPLDDIVSYIERIIKDGDQ